MMFGQKKEDFQDWNRAFVQMIMSKGFMTGQDVYRGVKDICNSYQAHKNFPKIDTNSSDDIAEMIDIFMEKANLALEPIQLQISKTHEEMKAVSENPTYTQYYVMAPTYENESIAKLQKNYGEPELEWLKLVAGHLVETEDRMANQNELINLCRDGGNNTAKRKLNVTEADRAMTMFVEDGYLMKVRQSRKGFKLALGPRFMIEMEGWLKESYGEDMWQCGACDRVGMVGTQCTKRGCESRFHLYCVDRGNKDPKCSRCKTSLKIEGVASKRQ
eukprot:GFUD01016239.1.p1 GENE.GFUD01016239.1~~GFUD01016239.1.p1  ORF type:complete len:273 (-),score=89.04 GFUD01016239.1:92-910(-)